MMRASDAAYELIRRSESLRLKPYLCPSGLPAQGYGRSHGVRLTDPPITEEQAEAWLREDVANAERLLAARFAPSMKRSALTQGQVDALVSFVYNIRQERFNVTHCTLLRWLNQGLPSEQVAEQFDRWVYGRDPSTGRAVKLSGLVKRRAAERALFLS